MSAALRLVPDLVEGPLLGLAVDGALPEPPKFTTNAMDNRRSCMTCDHADLAFGLCCRYPVHIKIHHPQQHRCGEYVHATVIISND